MKKLVLLLALLICIVFTSCYSTRSVYTPDSIEASINSTISKLSDIGYSFSGENSTTKTEAVVTGVSYSKYSGYGTAMANKVTQGMTYIFTDSVGNNVEFSVAYPDYQLDKYSNLYTTEISVVGCQTSNPKDYKKACNDIIKPTMNNTKISSTEVYDEAKTYINTLIWTTVICAICCVPLLLN